MSSGRRLYIGRLSQEATRRDVEQFFDKYGTLVDVRIMNGFGFVEFENLKDAEDAVADKNGQTLLDSAVVLEVAKDARRRDNYEPDRYGRPPAAAGGIRGPPRAGRGRVIVKGLAPGVSWQDLKDFGRDGGPVSFADVDRDREGQGVIEYPSLADAEDAVRRLDGTAIRGQPVTVVLDADQSSGGGYAPDPYARRDDRGYDRDSYGGGGGYRRERSRSPRRDPYARDDRRDDRDRYDSRPRDDHSDYYRRDDPYAHRSSRRDDYPPPPRRDERDYRDEPRRDYRDEPRRDDRDRRGDDRDDRRRSPPPAERRRSRSPLPAGGDDVPAAAPAASGSGGWD